MPRPVLKKLRARHVPAAQLASLLEKHAGSGANEMHCLEALAAIADSRNPQVRGAVLVVGLLLPNDPPCERLRVVASQLRSMT